MGDAAESVRLRPEGAGVFDLQTVATILANGVQRIYTFNPRDFQVFAELAAVTPTWRAGTMGGQKRYLTFFHPHPFSTPRGIGDDMMKIGRVARSASFAPL